MQFFPWLAAALLVFCWLCFSVYFLVTARRLCGAPLVKKDFFIAFSCSLLLLPVLAFTALVWLKNVLLFEKDIRSEISHLVLFVKGP